MEMSEEKYDKNYCEKQNSKFDCTALPAFKPQSIKCVKMQASQSQISFSLLSILDLDLVVVGSLQIRRQGLHNCSHMSL